MQRFLAFETYFGMVIAHLCRAIPLLILLFSKESVVATCPHGTIFCPRLPYTTETEPKHYS